MSVSQKSTGRLVELADTYALGAYVFGHGGSSPSSPTRDKTGNWLKTVFQIKVEEVNNNTINLRCKLCCIRCNLLQRGYEKKAVDNDFCGFASLRNYRQLLSSCKGAINYSYYTPFFKFMTLAQLQVVSQQTQHIFRNTTVVQRI
jgi:hypothetical protein